MARLATTCAIALAWGAGCAGHAATPGVSDAAAGGDGGREGARDGGADGGGQAGDSGVLDRLDGQTALAPDGAAEAAGGCVPAIPVIAWESPYAAWSNGVPTDPSFFPIAVWLQGPWHASEIAQLGANIFIGNNAGTDPIAPTDLATLKSLGLYAILGQDSVGLADVADSSVASNVIGWWMDPDEPDNAQSLADGGCCGPPVAPATLVSRYDAYRAQDPTRPVYVGLGQGVAYDGWEGRGSNAPPESGYAPASDIASFDIYPYNNCGGDTNEQATCGQFWLNAFGVDRLRQWSARGQAAWTTVETTVIAAGTTTGPTPAQTASEVWLALIHGAGGIVYFLDSWKPSFREDAIFETPAMVSSVTALDGEIRSLAPVLNSATLPGLVTVHSSNAAAPIDLAVKAHGGTLYVLSAISRAGTATGSFTIAGMSGSVTATVIGENRTLDVTGGTFDDAFAANAVHVYAIDLSSATCP